MTKEKKEKTVKLFRTLKQNLYVIKYLPEIKLRKGIENIIRQAIDQNVKLAIVSSSHEKQINALLKSQLVEFYDKFVIVLGKESGKKTDNNGFLHKKCLGQLGVKKENAIVIEDAGDGLRAATLAGISTAVFYNDYTFGDDFRHAKLVAPSIDFFSLKLLTEICLSKINQ
jgi:HAD superfamily hydrolase (TIGR01509 family)